jgi:tripartite-type tricarboxylate transporter receptor subunit TctC
MNFMYSFNRGQVLIAAMAAGALGLISGSLQAQGDASSYPTQSARIIVPYPPGGGADFLARLLAERAQTKWGQTMIVENRSGAGGNVGTEFVFRSSPDGYTMLFTAQPPLVANKSLYRKLNFDPDLMAPAAVMATGYSVLVVPPRLPVNTVQEFIERAFAAAEIEDWERYIVKDPRFERPAEVDLLLGDASKARSELGWDAKVSFEELVTMMYENDLAEESRRR